MTTTYEELSALRSQLDAVTDQARLRNFLNTYFLGFDDRRVDEQWLDSIFTDDVSVDFPAGSHAGLDGLTDLHMTPADGWRFRQLTIRLVWTHGDPPTREAAPRTAEVEPPRCGGVS